MNSVYPHSEFECPLECARRLFKPLVGAADTRYRSYASLADDGTLDGFHVAVSFRPLPPEVPDASAHEPWPLGSAYDAQT